MFIGNAFAKYVSGGGGEVTKNSVKDNPYLLCSLDNYAQNNGKFVYIRFSVGQKEIKKFVLF
jgi:hypothetical protein